MEIELFLEPSARRAANLAMSEELLDSGNVVSAAESLRRGVVAKVVESKIAESEAPDETSERLGDALTVRVLRQYEVVWTLADTQGSQHVSKHSMKWDSVSPAILGP